MSAARLVRSTSCVLSSAATPGSSGPPADSAVAVAVASLSDAATRRLSCRAASVFACVTSRSTSPSSVSRRASSPAIRPVSSDRVAGGGAAGAGSVIVGSVAGFV
jgi:hypothetical protein